MIDPIDALYQSVRNVVSGDEKSVRTAKLMREGTVKIAKKLAEEAVEVGHEAILKDRKCVIEESADLMYNLVVLWADAGIEPSEIWSEMERRRQMLGLAEKLPKLNIKAG